MPAATAILAIGAVLAGSDRPLTIASRAGAGGPAPGALAVETVLDRDPPDPRRLSELTAEDVARRGVSVAVVRLPKAHDTQSRG